MDAQAIFHELTYAEGLPREALKAASAKRGEMVSLFLEEVETYLALESGRSGNADAALLHFPPPRRVAGESCLSALGPVAETSSP